MKFIFFSMVLFFSSLNKEPKKDCWQIFVNKKQVACGFTGELSNVTITAKPNDKLKISYSYKGNDPNWKRSIIIMNDKRLELWRKDLPTNSGIVSIDAKTLQNITNNANFTIHTIAIPMDASLAATVRVASVLLCNVQWKMLITSNQ